MAVTRLAVLAACVAARAQLAAAAVSVKVTSEPVAVWDTLKTGCEKLFGPIDLPDTPPNAFVDGDGQVKLFSSDTTTRVSKGPTLLSLKRDCAIVFNSTDSPDPSLYATDEFIDATYAFDNGTVVALLHMEYPGMKFPGQCASGFTYPHCWTVAMTLAVSHDWGATWAHARTPPGHMVAAPPYRYNGSAAVENAGWGDSGGLVRSPRDGFYYAVVHNRFRERVQGNGSCVIRTNDLTDPTSWRGWGGASRGFSVRFASPYSGGGAYDPAEHACAVLDIPDCVVLGTVWSAYLESFVATLTCGDENGGDGGSVFYYALSGDMVRWTRPEVLYKPPFYKGDTFFNYPKLLDVAAHEDRGDRNFETIGQRAQLFYVSVTHDFYTEGRQLYAVNVTFSKGQL